MKTRASEVRLTEEQKAKYEVDRDDKEKAQRELVRDLNQAFGTSSGMRALKFIMDLSGYQKSSVVADPGTGEIFTDSTVYNEARRNLYLTLRRYLKKAILRTVEVDGFSENNDELFN